MKTAATLTAYNNTNIPVTGKCTLIIQQHGKKFYLPFIIAKTLSPPIIGAKSSQDLDLIRRVMSVNNDQTDFYTEFSDCFGELGTLSEKHHIQVDPHVPPVIHSARQIPLSLKDRLDSELNRMLKLGIIVPVNEPSQWVNQLVVTEKPNGKLRVCIDPCDLNKAILRQRYQLPTAEQLFSEMSGAKFFTKLDASNGYWQIPVDEESSKLLTFACPKGCFRFTRLPYGIHSASEVFQSRIENIIKDIPRARNSQDDIIIWGETIADLESSTKMVLHEIRQHGLKLNKSKCVFNVDKIVFLGHVITSNGIYPDPDKVKAVANMPAPKTKSELQTFLGMIAYLGKFISHLSDASAPLRKLIEKDSIWDFTETHKKAFHNVKTLIVNCPCLKIFSPKFPTKITCDASSIGLGATLE